MKHENLHIINHPLVQHKLSLLREIDRSKKAVKELVDEITLLLVYEATKSLPMTTQTINTPLEECEVPMLAGKKPVILPILRAGNGMLDSFLRLMPSARVGHIGLYRNEETLEPVLYYIKLPQDSEDRHYFICDPMLATGGSAVITVNELKKRKIKNFTFLCMVAAPEGVEKLLSHHPEVQIYTASLDRCLNHQGYILPGLGDAGDRLFGTK
ncbi:MAG: Uracil phosphoribosyltransferase [Legionellaceae bacterium]